MCESKDTLESKMFLDYIITRDVPESRVLLGTMSFGFISIAVKAHVCFFMNKGSRPKRIVLIIVGLRVWFSCARRGLLLMRTCRDENTPDAVCLMQIRLSDPAGCVD